MSLFIDEYYGETETERKKKP